MLSRRHFGSDFQRADARAMKRGETVPQVLVQIQQKSFGVGGISWRGLKISRRGAEIAEGCRDAIGISARQVVSADDADSQI